MSRDDFHKCAVPGCDVLTGRYKLMCPAHWAKVPQPLQNKVWATYHKMTAETGDVEDVVVYRAAVKDALDAIEKSRIEKA